MNINTFEKLTGINRNSLLYENELLLEKDNEISIIKKENHQTNNLMIKQEGLVIQRNNDITSNLLKRGYKLNKKKVKSFELDEKRTMLFLYGKNIYSKKFKKDTTIFMKYNNYILGLGIQKDKEIMNVYDIGRVIRNGVKEKKNLKNS